jgi:hypothetical protein
MGVPAVNLFSWFRRWGRSKDQDGARQALRDAISIEVPGNYYPTLKEVTNCVTETAAFRPEAIGWIAPKVHEQIRSGANWRSIADTIARQGRVLTGDEAKQAGLHPRTKIGERFVQAVAANSVRDAKQALFIAIQKAASTANRRYHLQKHREAGVTKVKFMSCHDERDCAAAREIDGSELLIEKAVLPLPGCEAPYCRCMFQAVVEP